jgi:hypothetical protein
MPDQIDAVPQTGSPWKRASAKLERFAYFFSGKNPVNFSWQGFDGLHVE